MLAIERSMSPVPSSRGCDASIRRPRGGGDPSLPFRLDTEAMDSRLRGNDDHVVVWSSAGGAAAREWSLLDDELPARDLQHHARLVRVAPVVVLGPVHDAVREHGAAHGLHAVLDRLAELG